MNPIDINNLAPKPDPFYVAATGDHDDRVNLICCECPADDAVVATWHSLDCRSLNDINTDANRHWRDHHRKG